MSWVALVIFIGVAIWGIDKHLTNYKSEKILAIRKKNRLINEAQKVREFLDNKEWHDMTYEEKECYTIASERLRSLLSYKKNQTPDYSNLTSWPYYYSNYLKNKHDKFTD